MVFAAEVRKRTAADPRRLTETVTPSDCGRTHDIARPFSFTSIEDDDVSSTTLSCASASTGGTLCTTRPTRSTRMRLSAAHR